MNAGKRRRKTPDQNDVSSAERESKCTNVQVESLRPKRSKCISIYRKISIGSDVKKGEKNAQKTLCKNTANSQKVKERKEDVFLTSEKSNNEELSTVEKATKCISVQHLNECEKNEICNKVYPEDVGEFPKSASSVNEEIESIVVPCNETKTPITETVLSSSPTENLEKIELKDTRERKKRNRTKSNSSNTEHRTLCSNNGPLSAHNMSENVGKKCPYCSFVYTCPRFLNPHLKEKHGPLLKVNGNKFVYKCLYCVQCCTRPCKIVSHMHHSHPEKFIYDDLKDTHRFRCTQECDLIFSSEIKLNKHLARDHKMTIKPPRRKRIYNVQVLQTRAKKLASGEAALWGGKSATSKHKASTLSTEFHRSSRIKDCHPACWAIAAESGTYTCGYCQKIFLQHSVCVVHESAHEVISLRKSSKDLKCGDCSEEFTKPNLLAKHRAEVHKKAVYNSNQCGECGKIFTSASYVKNHVDSVHLKKAKFLCNICGKAYRHRTGLTNHQAARHNAPSKPQRLRVCDLCHSVFKSREGYKSHMLKHSGIRPFLCRYCGRKFYSRTHLKAHEYIHTGVKVHHCPVCKKSFTNQGSLYNHLYKYAVHGTLPKLRKLDDGSSRRAFDEALKSLGASGNLKRATVQPRKRKKKNSQKSTSGNVGLDTLAQVAGMVNGLLTEQSMLQEDQSEITGVLLDVDGRELSAMNTNVPFTSQETIAIQEPNPEIQIVALEAGLENAQISLPEGHQVVVIMPPGGDSLLDDHGSAWLEKNNIEEGEVRYIQIKMGQENDIMDVVEKLGEVPLRLQSQPTAVQEEQVLISVNEAPEVPEITGENDNISVETQYVVVTENVGDIA